MDKDIKLLLTFYSHLMCRPPSNLSLLNQKRQLFPLNNLEQELAAQQHPGNVTISWEDFFLLIGKRNKTRGKPI